jgi:hypothetical protein
MDFVNDLPMSGQYNCVLVVVDYFTKYAHFIPLHHPFTAAIVAKAFMKEVYRLHGMPGVIVSDRDRIFTSNLWRELFKLSGVELHMSSSYHPQSDGQTERLNQTMETFLRCFANACPSKWCQWLHLAEFWYKNCHHSAIGRSPFQALYAYEPKHFGIYPEEVVSVPELSVWFQDRQVMHALIKQHLSRAQLRMKKQLDKHRSERQFEIGDKVFVKLQPYVQSSLAPRSNQQLAFKFFGSYKVLSRLGSVAYKLALPPSSSIHLVFHVSQLKKCNTEVCQVSPSLPSDVDLPRVPERVLQSKLVARGDRFV